MARQRYQKGNLRLSPRRKGPWVWQLRYYDEVGGKRTIRSIVIGDTHQLPNASRARAKADAILIKVNETRERYCRRDTTVAELIDRFIVDENLRQIKADKTGRSTATALKYSTATSYLNILLNYIQPRWGRTPVKDIRPAAIQSWLVELRLAPKTIHNIKALLHRLLEKAMLWEMLEIQRNPVELVEIKGITRRMKKPTVLTLDQFCAISQSIPEPYRTMVIVAQCTGLRVSEVLALQWHDVDFDGLVFKVERAVVNGRVDKVKTEYSRDYLPMDRQFAAVLQEWRANCPDSPQEWIFPNPSTLRPYHASTIQQDYIRKAASQIGLANVGWHTFRHTYRAWLDATGAPVGVQQKLMRHAEIATTMNVYGDALMDSKREANSKVVRMALASVYGNA